MKSSQLGLGMELGGLPAAGVEEVPADIVLACVLAVLDPLDAANGHNLVEIRQEWTGLFCVDPISVEEKPSGFPRGEEGYHPMQDRPRPGRVRYDEIAVGDIDRFDVGGGISFVDAESLRVDIASEEAVVSCVLEVVTESAVARTQFREG